MLHITLNPKIFTRPPLNKLPESARRTYVYVVENAASTASQTHLFPKQDSGLINGEQYVQGQSTTRSLAIGINGVVLDEETVKRIFVNEDVVGGTLLGALAYAVQCGNLIVTTDAGVVATASDIFERAF